MRQDVFIPGNIEITEGWKVEELQIDHERLVLQNEMYRGFNTIHMQYTSIMKNHIFSGEESISDNNFKIFCQIPLLDYTSSEKI